MLIWLRLLFPPTTSPYHITGTSAFTSVACCPVQFVVGCRSNLVALLFYLFVISLVTKLGTTFSQSGSQVIFRGFIFTPNASQSTLSKVTSKHIKASTSLWAALNMLSYLFWHETYEPQWCPPSLYSNCKKHNILSSCGFICVVQCSND